MATKKQVLIVGGGFGGIKAALELADDPRFAVTLMSDRPDFWYFPSLYLTATGTTNKVSIIPLKKLFEGKPVDIVLARAFKIDRVNKQVFTGDKHVYSYDIAILALGVVTNYFGIPGMQEFSYGIKTVQEVEAFKAHLHKQMIDDRKPDLNYVIVGGGPTGIELAGELPGYLKRIMDRHGIKHKKVHIDLVEGAPHLMPRLPKTVGRAIERRLRRLGVRLYLGKMVQGETIDALTVGDKPIRSHTVIWTAGQANSPFFTENNFAISPRHKVAVDEYLRADKDVFVIGDNADTPYSGMAQTALYDADFVAHNLKKAASDEPMNGYRPKKPVYVTPAGPHWAAVEWGKFHIYGWLGWLLREAADVRAFADIENPLKASEQWLKEFKHDDNCPICGDIA